MGELISPDYTEEKVLGGHSSLMAHKREKIGILVVLTIVIVCLGIFVKTFEKKQHAFWDIVAEDGTIIKAWYNENDGTYYYFLPSYIDLQDVSFALDGQESISLNGKTYSGADRLESVSLDESIRVSGKNSHTERNVRFMKSANIATMYVETATGALDTVFKQKGKKEVARVTVVDECGDRTDIGADSSIKSRGNSTWYHTKKPFGIDFKNKESLLGMRAASKWVLLADFLDKSAIRNKLVMDTASAVGLENTPDNRWVDLYLNGEYYGLYLLCQSPETWYEWCDIDTEGLYIYKTQTFERYDDATAPVLIENDKVLLDICFPKKMTWSQSEEAKSIVETVDHVVSKGTDDEICERFDLESWAIKYLIDEIFENYDSGFIGSYFYKKADDDKIYGGPIWDYDNSMGNLSGLSAGTLNPQILFAANAYRTKAGRILWYSNLYEQSEFIDIVKTKNANDFLSLLQNYVDKGIDAYAERIEMSKKCNDLRWKFKDFDTEVDYVKNYLLLRSDFLTDIWINNNEYCAVQVYAKPNGANFQRVYVRKGEAVTDREEYYKWLEGIDNLYLEGTEEPYDLSEPITQDITLYYKTNVSSGRISQIMKKLKIDEKVAVCLASMLLLPILCLLLAKQKKRGI